MKVNNLILELMSALKANIVNIVDIEIDGFQYPSESLEINYITKELYLVNKDRSKYITIIKGTEVLKDIKIIADNSYYRDEFKSLLNNKEFNIREHIDLSLITLLSRRKFSKADYKSNPKNNIQLYKDIDREEVDELIKNIVNPTRIEELKSVTTILLDSDIGKTRQIYNLMIYLLLLNGIKLSGTIKINNYNKLKLYKNVNIIIKDDWYLENGDNESSISVEEGNLLWS